MPKLTIDGTEVEVDAGLTVLQACEQLGIEIPRFCYHERLSIAGNCRMCLVEMERAPKPIASCAMPVGEGMVIRTNTEKVKKMREGVMEFLLINHPLDCPICDQGGECDLQDQAMAYGIEEGRYKEAKRAVAYQQFSPLVNGIMTRCIHCTRCIRFMSEVAGAPDMGATFRGEHMQVGTYIGKTIDSELSGNIVDLCPVGALTSGPYAYQARSWELKKTESIDVLDAQGCNIRVDVRGREVMRILPRLNEEVNEEWLGDKSRFACDGLKRQRLDQPYVRRKGKLEPCSWEEALGAAAKKLKGADGKKIAAIAGDLVDCEAMTALKDLMAGLGSPNIDCRQDGAKLDAGCRAGYVFNSTIAGIDQADALLLVGSDPRWEAPVLNARIRRRYLAGGGFVPAVIGPDIKHTYKTQYLGSDVKALQDLLAGKGDYAKALKAAKKPMMIVGQGALARADGGAILALCRSVAEKFNMVQDGWNGFNVLHTAAARVGGLDLGFVPGEGGLDVAGIVDAAGKGEIEVVYLLGADEIDTDALGKAFVIYQGHHGDAGAHRADVILPGAAYTEKNATYVNTEGRVQRGRLAVFPPGEAKEDWKILRALSESLSKGAKLPYDTLDAVRARMVEINPVFAEVDRVTAGEWGPFGQDGEVSASEFQLAIGNYYQTDSISRASVTMAQCTDVFVAQKQEKTGTHG